MARAKRRRSIAADTDSEDGFSSYGRANRTGSRSGRRANSSGFGYDSSSLRSRSCPGAKDNDAAGKIFAEQDRNGYWDEEFEADCAEGEDPDLEEPPSMESHDFGVVDYSPEVIDFINDAAAQGQNLVTKNKLLTASDAAVGEIKDRKLRNDIKALILDKLALSKHDGNTSVDLHFVNFVSEATSVSVIPSSDFVKPSEDFSKDLILTMHYPTFCTAHAENGYAADESDPCTNALLEVGFSEDNSLWLEEFYNRMRAPKERGRPTSLVSKHEINPSLDTKRNLVQIQHKFSEKLEHLSTARFALVFRKCQRERVLKRQGMRAFDITYEDVQIHAGACYHQDRLRRLYLFARHPEDLKRSGYAQGNTSIGLQNDVALGIAAALAGIRTSVTASTLLLSENFCTVTQCGAIGPAVVAEEAVLIKRVHNLHYVTCNRACADESSSIIHDRRTGVCYLYSLLPTTAVEKCLGVVRADKSRHVTTRGCVARAGHGIGQTAVEGNSVTCAARIP